MKRTALLCLFLPAIANSQLQYGVAAEANTSFVVYSFTNHKPNCLPDFSEAISLLEKNVLIIGDTSCGKYFYYIVALKDGARLIETYNFYDTVRINKDLITVKENIPDIEERYKKGLPEFEQAIAKKKDEERKREEDETAEYNKMMKDTLASLQKRYDKILAIYAKENLILWDWAWSYPSEYSSMPEITVQIINPYRKKIKYVWVTFRAYNAVDDPVPAFRGNATGKGIGPIEYGDKGGWTFDNIYYSKVIETIKITQIKIQFFDGTFKTFANPRRIYIDVDE